MDNNSSDTPNTETDSGDLFNTAAGWVLFAAGLGLGLSIVAGKIFHGTDPQRPEQLGYVIEVAETDSGPAEVTIEEALNMMEADALVAAGERVFAKCQACHSIDQGGANGVGPNLYGVVGSPFANKGGFGYSSALSGAGGTWGWEEMNEWLANPRGYVDGTTMGFAGISSIEDRAAVAAYMNAQGSNLPIPEYTPPAEEVAEANAEAEVEAEQNAAEETSEETAAAES